MAPESRGSTGGVTAESGEITGTTDTAMTGNDSDNDSDVNDDDTDTAMTETTGTTTTEAGATGDEAGAGAEEDSEAEAGTGAGESTCREAAPSRTLPREGTSSPRMRREAGAEAARE